MTVAALPWLLVALPAATGLVGLLLGPRGNFPLSGGAWIAMAALTGGLAASVAATGPLVHAVGSWGAPLGIVLRADGLSVLMLAMAVLVFGTVLFYAQYYYCGHASPHEPRFFSPLTWLLWAGVNALFLSDDIFNLYVTLELLTLAAAGLAALSASPSAIEASLRYLMAALAASTAFLLGVALLYGASGTLALPEIAAHVSLAPQAPVYAAALLAMTAGLALKTALFPLHGWLPPAHGGAATPVSALLSALVVKASFFVLLRLWLGPFASLMSEIGQGLGLLGAMAILWGSMAALMQARLKMVVAYSTVAQMGYLFMAFDLLRGDSMQLALSGMAFQAVAHGLAKAAMFLAAGALLLASGNDTVSSVRGLADRQPVAVFAFVLAGISLAGMPPTIGFAAKWFLLQAAWRAEAWHWMAVMLLGSMLTAAYVLRVLRQAFLPPDGADTGLHPVPAALPRSAMTLALMALLTGFLANPLLALLDPASLVQGG